MTAHTWACDCGRTVASSHGADVLCDCGQWFNAWGQRLRHDWASNPSWDDDEVGDLEGFELAQLRGEF